MSKGISFHFVLMKSKFAEFLFQIFSALRSAPIVHPSKPDPPPPTNRQALM